MLQNKLRALRENKDIPLIRMAEAVEVSRQTIHSIETNKYVPSVELALKIAQFLALKVEDIFDLKTAKGRGK